MVAFGASLIAGNKTICYGKDKAQAIRPPHPNFVLETTVFLSRVLFCEKNGPTYAYPICLHFDVFYSSDLPGVRFIHVSFHTIVVFRRIISIELSNDGAHTFVSTKSNELFYSNYR